MQIKKPKVAFFSLTACEGCQFTLLDLGEKFFNFLKRVELLDFSLIEEIPFPRGKVTIDVSFVEGLPIKREEIKLLKKIRKQTKTLVAMGNCATFGGIPEMKNYQGREKTIRFIYKHLKEVENPEIKEIDKFVKVDFYLTGCPINGEEFLKCAKKLIKGKIPKILQKPVCQECPHQGKETCFLRKREICFGPITLGGCQAICLKNAQACLACRGILKNVNARNFISILERFKSPEEVRGGLEIFGIKEDIFRTSKT